jgi:hypothetical protein
VGEKNLAIGVLQNPSFPQVFKKLASKKALVTLARS